ncbi:hypothetical protein Z968_05190 [Clostridium novyi A str. 4552]|uniref:Putative peptidoglycan-binding domain-containing protein n=1 Tax=Clostridium novyi A str. 4552 TaxID=1444289 RepID=A0A0A0IBJ0_CLONO|nr:hypothetical protein [Clostridium novyi]KGM96975.1 hypothetical protein Z968_05190 [Clostridium novyi A str. 4552]
MLKSKTRWKIGTSLILSTFILTSSVIVASAVTNNNGKVTKESVQHINDNVASKPQKIEVKKLDNGLRVEYMGNLENMPSELKTPHVKQAFKDGNWKIKVVSGYTTYTYRTAPQDVRSRYEAACKSVNKVPKDSDVISIPKNVDK